MFAAMDRITRLLHLRGESQPVPPDAEHATLDTRAAELLARVAHEMRQPLSAALSALHVMRSSGSESDRRRATIVVDTQFTRMSRLVDDLTETTRLRVSRPSLRIEQLDLRRVVRELVEAVDPQIARKRQRLIVDLPSQPVWVRGDSIRLQQVMSNVVLNAVTHTDEGGLLQLALTCRPGQAVLMLSDTGHGIDPKVLPHIFEPFRKGAADSTDGLGIGLAVARQLVELHHGVIRATSAGPECGSQFVVTLPLAPAPVAAIAPFVAESSPYQTAQLRPIAQDRQAGCNG